MGLFRKSALYITPSESDEVGYRWNSYRSEVVSLPSGGVDQLSNNTYTGLVSVGKLAHRHPNGGGWVADTAYVSPSVVVKPTGFVSDNAIVLGQVVIENYAGVFGNARVFGKARVGEGSGLQKVYNNAQVFGEAFFGAGEGEAFSISERDGLVFGLVTISGGAGIIEGIAYGSTYGEYAAIEDPIYIDVGYPSGPQMHGNIDPITRSSGLQLPGGMHDIRWEPLKSALWQDIHNKNIRDGFSPTSF